MSAGVGALGRGFDDFAEDYDRTRPICPARLFDDLVALAGLSRGDRIVEIGCGTGQATVPLAARGLAITAIEPGPNLGAIARRRTAPYPGAEVVTSAFEDWVPDGRPAQAVVAFNSLHWIAPEVRYTRPAELLGPGGAMAVVSCHWARPADAEPFWTEVQEDYRAVGCGGEPPPPPEAVEARGLPAEATPLFEEVAARRYLFQVVYSAGDYLANLASQSSTRQLGPERSAEFLARVRARLAAWPQLTATFVATLTIGRRR